MKKIQDSITENWNQVGHLESDHLIVSDHVKKIDMELNDFDKMISETVRSIKDLEMEKKSWPNQKINAINALNGVKFLKTRLT